MLPDTLPRPLASVLITTYARTLTAREAVEHRLESIPEQQKIVAEWRNNPAGTAHRRYPGLDIQSYPVQTRMSREFEQLERYYQELPERFKDYAQELQRMRRIESEVAELASRAAKTSKDVPCPQPHDRLRSKPWPSSWSMTQAEASQPRVKAPRPSYPEVELVLVDKPTPQSFELQVGEHTIELVARYAQGIDDFVLAMKEHLSGEVSSRWTAIIEAIRLGISWPVLDQYLEECPSPWLPRFYVDEQFGLRGSLARRDDLADFLAKLTPDAARWYLATSPGRVYLKHVSLVDREIAELLSAGLVRLGAHLTLEQLLSALPFSEVKSLFILAGLKAPASFEQAQQRFTELRAVRSEDQLRQQFEETVDPNSFLEVMEVPGFDREERLGPRARANLLVSTLCELDFGESEAEAILTWPVRFS